MDMVQKYMGSELMAELESWKRQEDQLKKLFSAEVVQDKEFLKLKLKEFDRIFYKHRYDNPTTDERAVMTVLKYQRLMMQKSLYPGLITRMVMSAYSYIEHKFNQSMLPKATHVFNPPPISFPGDYLNEEKSNIKTARFQSEQLKREQNRGSERQEKLKYETNSNHVKHKRRGRSM